MSTTKHPLHTPADDSTEITASSASRRTFLKKAAYVPPTIVALGTLTSMDIATAQSCDPLTDPFCPPPPP